jgi:hypothetical protein
VLGRDRAWREDKDHGVRIANEAAEPSLPRLAGRDVFLIEIGLEAAKLETRDELAGKSRVLARIGNKNLKLGTRAGVGRDILCWRHDAPLNS